MKKNKRNILIIVAVAVAVVAITLAIVLPLTLSRRGQTFTVTFDSNGGTAVESVTGVAYNSLISEPPSPTRAGHEFAGWFKNAKFNGEWKFASDKVKSDITLYAKWNYDATDGMRIVVNGSECTVMGVGNASDVSNLSIPSVYEGLPVTTIAQEAFRGNKSIENVFIPSSVTTVHNAAFSECDNLQSVVFEGSTTSIGEQAFYNCKKLNGVKLPDAIETISNGLFYGCSGLKSIEIPSNLLSIGDRAFYGCSKLSEFDFPSALTSIGNGAFGSCVSLTEINLPASLKDLGYMAFANCIGVQSLTVDDKNTFFFSRVNGNQTNCIISRASMSYSDILDEHGKVAVIPAYTVLVGCQSSNIPSLTGGNKIVGIGPGAFCGCSSLTSVRIPSTVTKIWDEAFSGCSSLTSVLVPSSVEEIGDYAFSSCGMLENVLFGKIDDSLEDYRLGNYNIKKIGREAFAYCNLVGIYLPDSLTSLGAGVFYRRYSDWTMGIRSGHSGNNLRLIIEKPDENEQNPYEKSLNVMCVNGLESISGLA